MNIKSVTKPLFHCFRLFVDIKRLYFDNIKIVPIFLKTWINLYQNWIEIFGYISRSSNFISNRIYSNRIGIELYLISFLCRFFKIDHAWWVYFYRKSQYNLLWVIKVYSSRIPWHTGTDILHYEPYCDTQDKWQVEQRLV